MSESIAAQRSIPRLPPRPANKFHWPPDPPGHEMRMATLRDLYCRLGLCGKAAVGLGTGRPVRVGGVVYPSASAAERALGTCPNTVGQAARRGCKCRGMTVEYV